MKPTEPLHVTCFAPSTVPGWAIPHGPVTNDVEAAFMAGSALNSLDSLVRSAPPWCRRQRLALKCSVVAVELAGRTEDEAQLRDCRAFPCPRWDDIAVDH